jgi:hypothetical protein
VVFLSLVTETASGQDHTSALVEVNAAVFELATGLDSVQSVADFSVSLNEGAQAEDAGFASAVFQAAVLEAGVAEDSPLGQLLWQVINTAQTQNWQVITTAQLTLQVTIGGGFSSGAVASGPFSGLGGDTRIAPLPDTWQNINSSQTSAWILVKTA